MRWILVLVMGAWAGCGTSKAEREKQERAKQARIGLLEVVDEINNEVQRTARQISNRTEKREIRRVMVVWQMRTLDSCRRALQRSDARWVFIDLWTMLYQTRAYIRDGAAKDLLGPETPIAVQSLDRLLGSMDRRARALLSVKQYEEIGKAAREWALANPIEGEGMDRPGPSLDDGRKGGIMNAVTNLPSEIFSLGGGVKDTAGAIDKVALAADRAVDTVDYLPIVLRWQTELLLFSLEEQGPIARILDDVTRISKTVEEVGKSAQKLPGDFKATLIEAIHEVEKTQPEFRRTLAESRGIVDQVHSTAKNVNTALDKAKEQGVWLEKTTLNAAEAGKAWEGAFSELNKLANPEKDPDEPPSEPSPPFDIKDAARTAEWATKAATEVHATVVELRRVIEGDGIDQRLRQIDETTAATLDRTADKVDGLVDRITIRGVILIFAFFAAMLLYRVLSGRFA